MGASVSRSSPAYFQYMLLAAPSLLQNAFYQLQNLEPKHGQKELLRSQQQQCSDSHQWSNTCSV